MKENMTKTFSFGKIDYYGKGRRHRGCFVVITFLKRSF